MPISPSKTRILLTIDKDLLAWVDAQAGADNRDRNNWIITQILNVKKEATPMKNLTAIYREWREVTEELLKDNPGSIDCGEQAVREDFSAFAELPETITFKEMFELEKQYTPKEVSPMKKEYHILYAGGTEMKNITPEEAKEILDSAETRHSSLSENEKLSIEESLLESDEDAETVDCAECLAVKIDGIWHCLPKAYR